KKDADAYHARAAVDLSAGTHTADSRSITIAEAGRLWIQSSEATKLERSTLEQYQRHLDLHIAPFIGGGKPRHLPTPPRRASRRPWSARSSRRSALFSRTPRNEA